MFDESIVSERPAKIQRKTLAATVPNLRQAVAVESSKTDDCGKAVHEDCYVGELKLEQTIKMHTEANLIDTP